MRVLVAEDSPVQRKLLLGLLRQLSMEAIEASNGEEALSLMSRSDGPRLALIDWEMPGLDGVELCRRVRALSLPVRPHLILVTAREAKADVVHALQAGADDYMTKPPDVGELLARVRVGLRNVQLQQDLLSRIGELETTLRRLDVVGTIAARAGHVPTAPPPDATISPALWALDPVRRVPERFESVVGSLGQSVGDNRRELWAHVALGLPDQGAWLDLTLTASRERLKSAFASLTNRQATLDQELLDTLSDLLNLVVKGMQHLLDAQGIPHVRPAPARAWVGAPRTEGAQRLQLERGGCLLTVTESAAPRKKASFSSLAPGLVLLDALHPPKLPDVEVLARGTLLRTSYLQRARSFFQGDSGEALVDVMPASPLTVAQSG